jgi:hypothetical protein
VIGETVGNFTVVRQLGRGGMGEVWVAEHKDIKTQVAIKVLLPHISAEQHHVQRFFNEAVAASKIKHSGIARIFDVGTHRGQAYLVMELLEGETLANRIQRAGRLSIGQLCDVGRQIASALAATHAEGITHRDLKPDNVFLVRDAELATGERVKLLDFGIAKLTGAAGGLTGAAGLMGTPAYMSPEQWQNSAKVDHRADAYSLGCVIFEMAAGRPPFVAESFGEACNLHLSAQPPSLQALVPGTPAALDELVARLLSKQPEQRPAMREVIATLQTIGQGQPYAEPAPPHDHTPVPGSIKPITTLSAGAGAVAATARAQAMPWRAIAIAFASVIVICGGVAMIARHKSAPGIEPAAPIAPAPPAPAPAPTPAPAPAVAPAPAPPPASVPVASAPVDAGVPAPVHVVAKPAPKPAATSPHEAEIERRLEALKRLHDDHTINDDEYNKRRAAVLKDL